MIIDNHFGLTPQLSLPLQITTTKIIIEVICKGRKQTLGFRVCPTSYLMVLTIGWWFPGTSMSSLSLAKSHQWTSRFWGLSGMCAHRQHPFMAEPCTSGGSLSQTVMNKKSSNDTPAVGRPTFAERCPMLRTLLLLVNEPFGNQGCRAAVITILPCRACVIADPSSAHSETAGRRPQPNVPERRLGWR